MPNTSKLFSTCTDRRFSQTNWDELPDEDLCKNVQKGCITSKNLLWRRYADFIKIAMLRENKRQHLPQRELNDAVQNLYFAFHIAVQRYNSEHHCHGKPASFKTFLNIVVTHEFAKYCAGRRIYQKYVLTNCDDQVWRNFIGETEETWPFAFDQAVIDDGSSMHWKNLLLNEFSSDGLAETLRQLKPKDRLLLQTWLHYGRDKEVAAKLGISPVAAKLRRERLFQRIRKTFRPK